MTSNTGFSFPAARSPPPSPQVCLPILTPLGVGHLSAQTRTPGQCLGASPCSILPSDIQAVSCVCLCVGTSPISTLGIFGKGWWGGPIQESSGLPPLTPSFLGLPARGSSHFF